LRIGLFIPFHGLPLASLPALARRAEARDYDSLWSEEADGFDGITPLAMAAAHTKRVRLATGVVNPFTRGPALLAQTAGALSAASGGRFVLGIGSSSPVIVEGWNGIPFAKPLTRMELAVTELRQLLDGGAGRGGFRLEPAPTMPVPIVVAALRARMLGFAGRTADGAITNFLPLSRAAQVVEAFGAPEKELAASFTSFALGDAGEDLAAARRLFTAYATVPVYTKFFEWLGLGERIAPMVGAWRDGQRRRALELVPDELVREIFLFGPPAAQRERLERYAAAGISTAVVALTAHPRDLPRMIDALAPR
jgi:probable F420-dependent oxidoreductase